MNSVEYHYGVGYQCYGRGRGVAFVKGLKVEGLKAKFALSSEAVHVRRTKSCGPPEYHLGQ